MNELSSDRRDALNRMLAMGASHRAIASAVGCSTQTVTRYSKMWAFSPMCGCGQPTGHRGWCHVRLAFSPQRRGWLADRWNKRADSELGRVVDAATEAAKALGHDLGRFVWGSASACSVAFAICRVCHSSVRVFNGESQWERYRDWERFAGTAVQVRCKTAEQRAAERAAHKEKRSWREAKRTLREVRTALREPSSWLNAASTPGRSSRP